jgi:hypothetical protein
MFRSQEEQTNTESQWIHPATHLLLFIVFQFWEGWVRETSYGFMEWVKKHQQMNCHVLHESAEMKVLKKPELFLNSRGDGSLV